MSEAVRDRASAGYVLKQWDPENDIFWETTGARVAQRNLWISIVALVVAFCVWVLWSVVAVNLDKVGFKFSRNQLFWLTALPALSGATLRVFYSFMVPIFGGRKWTVISTLSLLLPALGMGFALRDNTTSYGTLLILSLLCGLGGGNFSSSMANISFFFPKSRKGTATGLNAGIGNLGVSLAQFIVPLVISSAMLGGVTGDGISITVNGAAQTLWLQNASFVWVPFILMAAVLAWFGMNDIADARASFRDQAVIFRRKHNWLMCWLYVGTFGSFIGFSAGLALLTKSQFPGVDPTKYAFLGPLVGALTRPLGGWISDRLKAGAAVTLYTFLLMSVAIFGVLFTLPSADGGGSFPAFLGMFMLLFALSGIGNGSTFRMIPMIFLTASVQAAGNSPEARRDAIVQGNKEASAVLGFSGAVGAYGGFFIPKMFGSSLELTGSVNMAFYIFIGFYLSCMFVTWWFYARKGARTPC
ncbi:MAG: NarK family nitrate/nitrite MFS transporter [Lautropia sp.]|nr:NarK family nitrate/nitrite MFS transporter [Lautropia sp.]